MNKKQQQNFNDTKRRSLKLRRRLEHEMSKTHKDNPKIRRIKGQLSKYLEKMDDLDNGFRIGRGMIPETWDGK